MSGADKDRDKAREWQAVAREREEAAERATDPEQRQRLMDKARGVREKSVQVARTSQDTAGPA